MTTRIPTHSPTPSTPAPTIPTLGDDPFAVGALIFALLLVIFEFVRLISFDCGCCKADADKASKRRVEVKNDVFSYSSNWRVFLFAIDHVWLALAWGLFAGSYINDLLSNGSYLTNTASTTGQADLATVILASFGRLSIVFWWVYYAMIACCQGKSAWIREKSFWRFGFGGSAGGNLEESAKVDAEDLETPLAPEGFGKQADSAYAGFKAS